LYSYSGSNTPTDQLYFFFFFLALVLRFVAPFLARFFSFRAFSRTMIFASYEWGSTHTPILKTHPTRHRRPAGTGCTTLSGHDAPIDKAYFFFFVLALVLRFVTRFFDFFSFRAGTGTMIFPSSGIRLHARSDSVHRKQQRARTGGF
jgi:hypothetical protein